MTSVRRIVKRSHPALFYKESTTSSDAGQRDSLHLAILGTEPVFCAELALAATVFTSLGRDGHISWQPEVPALLMPGNDVVLLDWDELARRLPSDAFATITQATVLLSMVHGVEGSLREVDLVAYCDIRDGFITFRTDEDASDDREVRRLRTWWKGS